MLLPFILLYMVIIPIAFRLLITMDKDTTAAGNRPRWVSLFECFFYSICWPLSLLLVLVISVMLIKWEKLFNQTVDSIYEWVTR